MTRRPRSAQPLYRPLDAVVVRAPLLPVQRYLALPRSVPAERTADPLVRAAIAAASPALAAALDRPPRDERRAAALHASVLRYLIRMSTRPTPFALFAGAGLAYWDDATDLRIEDGPRPTRTRPDLGWLTGLVLGVERDTGLRERLPLVRNPCAFERDGRIHLSDRSAAGRPGRPDVSVRATPVVRRTLAAARTATAFADLVDGVLAQTPGATCDRVAGLVEELYRQDLLVSALRPPLTADPTRSVAGHLARMPEARTIARDLEGVLAEAERVDRGGAGPHTAGLLTALRSRIRAVQPAPPVGDQDVVQIDSALPLRGRTVSREIGADAARAAELLLRLHPAPGGPRHLAAYRSGFVARYGTDRTVPLLELLDPRFGLGVPTAGTAHAVGADPQAAARRSERLQALALTALRNGSREAVLDEADLDALQTWDPDPDRLPASLELSAFVLAASAAALDRGEYTLVVGPNLGGQAAGRGLGRFADLLEPDATELLRGIDEGERTRQPPGVAAELVYLPARHRSANVAVRPGVRGLEIPIGVAPGVPPDRVVAPDELAVVVRDGRLRLWWSRGATEVTVHEGHMLTINGAAPICRFLAEIGHDTVTALAGFSWGSAATLPFLPRVRVGRIVLAPARWRLARAPAVEVLRVASPAAFGDALQDWRVSWRLPRHVYLAAGDNRLLLDLDDPAQADQLRADLTRGRGRDLLLQEALPGPDHAWLPGPGGRYLSELVVPLIRTRTAPSVAPPPPAAARPRPAAHRTADRVRAPGSDWLYLTLHGPRAQQDELIAGPLRAFADAAVAAGSARSWFYVRYNDPDPHLRLRLRGDPETLIASLLPSTMSWAAALMAAGTLTRVGLDVYERELERYGGPEGLEVVEEVFAADSTTIAEQLALIRDLGAEVDAVGLAVLGIDCLLAALGWDDAARLQWCSGVAGPPKESSAAYRQRSAALCALLGGQAPPAVLDVMRRRTAALRPLAARLYRLEDDGVLSVPVTTLARSVVHLHCNRLGLDPATERVALGLLRRTLASLAAAPRRAGGDHAG